MHKLVPVALSIGLAAPALVASQALAQEKPVELKQAPGVEAVQGNCSACHSLDYIIMNSPFPAAVWDAEVTKMIRAFGAPIDEATAKTIADYLKKNYGS